MGYVQQYVVDINTQTVIFQMYYYSTISEHKTKWFIVVISNVAKYVLSCGFHVVAEQKVFIEAKLRCCNLWNFNITNSQSSEGLSLFTFVVCLKRYFVFLLNFPQHEKLIGVVQGAIWTLHSSQL